MNQPDDLSIGGVPGFSESAFEQFHAEPFGEVWLLARRLCRDDSEAQDVAQQAYLAVYRYWRNGRLREPPRHLLFRVAKRSAIDVLRGRHRRERLFAALPKDPTGGWVEGRLADALHALRPEDAALLMMQAASGFTYEELAGIERQSVGAIRSRLFRARSQLRRALYGVGS